MKTNRQKKILEIVSRHSVETQDDLIERLAEEGFCVTQATISRDIRELQLTKVLTSKGNYRYMPPKREEMTLGTKFNSALVESVLKVDHSGGLVIIHTYPGLANAVAGGVDRLALSDVLGCVAGDDTIFVATKNEQTARSISERLHSLMKEEE